jgi:hypothetical protein
MIPGPARTTSALARSGASGGHGYDEAGFKTTIQRSPIIGRQVQNSRVKPLLEDVGKYFSVHGLDFQVIVYHRESKAVPQGARASPLYDPSGHGSGCPGWRFHWRWTASPRYALQRMALALQTKNMPQFFNYLDLKALFNDFVDAASQEPEEPKGSKEDD